MNIGIKFQIPNEYGNYLKQILDKIDFDDYIWKIEETEAYTEEATDLFEMNEYSNQDFKKIVSRYKYYVVFTNIKLYEKEDNTIIRNYEDFLESTCILIILITDNVFTEIYSKDENILRKIYKNALESKFTNISYITENTLKRRCFSAYSD